MDENKMGLKGQTGERVTSPSSSHQQEKDTVCESHNLHAELSNLSSMPGEQDPISSRRSESAIKDLELKLESFINSKNHLLEQFNLEKSSLADKYDKNIRGMRQKHKLCEDNFKKEIEIANLKYKELEEKRSAELKSFREQLKSSADELAEAKRKTEVTQQELENVIGQKEKVIHELQNERSQMESKIKLQTEEFKNRKLDFEDKLREYQLSQEEDSRRIEQLNSNLNTANQEIFRLKSENEALSEKYGKSVENHLQMKEELNKIKEQLKAEEKVKHEKIETIRSLTEILDEHKAEIERLKSNVAELEANKLVEVGELQTRLINQEAIHEKRIVKLQDEKVSMERKLQEKITELEESLSTSRGECDNLRLNLEQKSSQLRLVEQQNERNIQTMNLERDSLNAKVATHEEQIEELSNRFAETKVNWELSQKELNKTVHLLEISREELDKRKNELSQSQENVRQIELKYSLLKQDFDDLKHELDNEKLESKEKLNQIANLKDLLSSSRLEIDQLKNNNEKLQRSIREQDELIRSVEADREDLRNTLADVEKSRLGIKTRFDSSKISYYELEHKYKLKEDEISRLNHKIESLEKERKLYYDEIEIAGKSLSQMKQLNTKLHEENLSLQKKNSTLELIKFETDRKQYSTPSHAERDIEIRRMKRETDQLREQVSLLEKEKRRIERSYAHLEKEYSAITSSRSHSRPSASAFLPRRTPSPSVATEQHRMQSEQSSSIMSRLLSDTSFLNSTLGTNTSKVDFSRVTRGIEALEQQHTELKQKVNALEQMVETASSDGDANTTKHSEDFGDLKTVETASVRSGRSDTFDYNGNYNEADEKLKLAQIKAQNLIESSDLFEEEISDLKSNRSRSQSLRRHNSVKSEDFD